MQEDRMAERSKALVLGTSHFGGVGSNPTPVILILLFLLHFYFSSLNRRTQMIGAYHSVILIRNGMHNFLSRSLRNLSRGSLKW